MYNGFFRELNSYGRRLDKTNGFFRELNSYGRRLDQTIDTLLTKEIDMTGVDIKLFIAMLAFNLSKYLQPNDPSRLSQEEVDVCARQKCLDFYGGSAERTPGLGLGAFATKYSDNKIFYHANNPVVESIVQSIKQGQVTINDFLLKPNSMLAANR